MALVHTYNESVARRSDFVNLQHFIAEVVDDLDGNLAMLRSREGTADGAVEGGPGFPTDVSDLQRSFQLGA